MAKSNTITTTKTRSTKTSPTKARSTKASPVKKSGSKTGASPKSGSKVPATKVSTKSSAKTVTKTATKSSPTKTAIKKSPVKKTTTKSPVKTVTKKSTDESITNRVTEIRIALQENYVEQKRLVAELEALLKLEQPKTRSNSKASPVSCIDFATPEPVPQPLAKLLDIDTELSKYQVTQKLYKYLSNQGLINNKTKEIAASKRLRRALGMGEADILDFYNMQSWIRKAYEKSADLDQQTSIEV